MLNLFTTHSTSQNKWIWPILILAISATLLTSPLFAVSTFQDGPDLSFHIFNITEYAREMQAGQVYPRWLGNWYGGYGAPIGVAYSPLLYLSGGLLVNLGFSVFAATKILLWGSLFVSGLAMYWLGREFLPIGGALVGGVIFQVAPYHIIDLYVRMALAEYVAFAWIPLPFLFAVYCIRKQGIPHYVALAVSVTLLILTHLLTATLIIAGLACFVSYFVLREQRHRLAILIKFGLAVGFGFALAAVYVLPALLENSQMYAQWFMDEGWGDYRNHFLFNLQWFGDDWWNRHTINISISGVLAILLAIFALVANLPVWKHRSIAQRRMGVAMLIVAAVSIFMALSISQPVWLLLPSNYLSAFSFPWRWLALTTLALSYLAGDMVVWMWQIWQKDGKVKRWLRYSLCGIGIVLLSANVVYGLASIIYKTVRQPQLEESMMTNITWERGDPLQMGLNGLLPQAEYLQVNNKDFNYLDHPFYSQRPIITSPDAQVDIVTWNSTIHNFNLYTDSKSQVNVRTFWFPGWEVLVNGKRVDVDTKPEDGTMLFEVQLGNSYVQVNFVDTPPRKAGSLISLGSFIGLVGLLIWDSRWRKPIKLESAESFL